MQRPGARSKFVGQDTSGFYPQTAVNLQPLVSQINGGQAEWKNLIADARFCIDFDSTFLGLILKKVLQALLLTNI